MRLNISKYLINTNNKVLNKIYLENNRKFELYNQYLEKDHYYNYNTMNNVYIYLFNKYIFK